MLVDELSSDGNRLTGSPTVRLVLAFFPAAEADLEQIARRMKKSGVTTVETRLSELCPEEEQLLVIRVQAPALDRVLAQLRQEQPLTTFVIPEAIDSPGPLLPEVPSQEPAWAEAIATSPTAAETSEVHLVKPKLEAAERDFERAITDLIASTTLGHVTGPSAVWLLENGYLVQNEVEDMRRLFTGPPPKPDPQSDFAQVYRLARSLVQHHGHEISREAVESALALFQSVRPFTLRELWSFSLMLRLAVVEELAHLAREASSAQQHREAAYFWADRLIGSSRREDALQMVLRAMDRESYSRSGPFLAAVAERLQGEEGALPALQDAADHWGRPLTDFVREEYAQEASRSLTAARAFGSIRTIARLDMTEIVEAASVVDAELRRDPSGVYAGSDFETRERCRQAVERISRWSALPELEVARFAVELADNESDPSKRHVTHFLVAEGIAELERRARARLPLRTRFVRATRRHAAFLYLSSITALTASLDALALALAYEVGVHNPGLLAVLGVLAVLPLSELAIQIAHAFVIATFPPSKLAKLDFQSGIPDRCATLVVVPMMLVSESVIRQELEKLEVRYLANRDGALWFALFSDFLDASEREMPDDAALLDTARNGIRDLNRRYPGARFLLFHRDREWSPSEQCWIGRERKRGKIEELNAFLTGHGSAHILREGELGPAIRYVITLDADTRLPPSAGRKLVETIAHPCNQVEIDPATKVRKRGYTIIQPRVGVTLPGATATRFTRAFADTSGLDPYCRSVSDIQQDYFNEASFHGKAIYDVRAFDTILGDRFPAETLLSHDLIEGAHSGVALASDIELLEGIPLDYASFSRRQHRWIRGDWQIAAWMFPRVPGPHGPIPNPLGAVGRWRIFDNLRRSLVPVASLLLLLFGWLTSVAPAVWSLVVALAILIPALAPLLDRWARQLEGTVHGAKGAADELVRSAILTAFLPHQAWLTLDAIVRSCYRRLISRRRLLEWQPAESAQRHSAVHISSTQRQMLIAAVASGALVLLLQHQGRLAASAGFLLLWMASPFLLTWLNRQASRPRAQELSESDKTYLQRAARLSWRFFDDLVNQESNWLPPDNTQLALRVEVAWRTSPTNIGLWFTSALAACDFGWLTHDDFCRRCSKTLATIDQLERYEGHLLNWYDIQNLSPLNPRYVSSVDSGNLLACLWTLESAIDEMLGAPVLDPRCLAGLEMTLNVLIENAGQDLYLNVPAREAARLLRAELDQHELIPRLRLLLHSAEPFRDIARWESASVGDRAYWPARFAAEIEAWLCVVDRHLRWMETLSRAPDSLLRKIGGDLTALRKDALESFPSLLDLERGIPAVEAIVNRRLSPELPPEAATWMAQLAGEINQATTNAKETANELRQLCDSVRRLAASINMGALYDKERKHFLVSLFPGAPPSLASHYDLLASEARLSSLVAVAKGDAPMEHWFALGRPMRTPAHGRQLLSWSGTMFEFLMPLLFTNNYENSLLDMACRGAVKGQIRSGARQELPWGVSESAYSALDARQTYQYRAFGVLDLALNPDVDQRPVVSPYSTMLALPLDARSGIANLRNLERRGLVGPMGFYESIDYSRASTREGNEGIIIYAYMAHHQGMTLAALDNIVHDDVIRRRFHSDARIQAFESLLYERVPLARLRDSEKRPVTPFVLPKTVEGPPDRVLSPKTTAPQSLLLGNGRYSVMLTNSGSGYSRWNEHEITRWRADSALDTWGTFLLLHDSGSRATWSATHQPVNSDRGESSVVFAADRAEFRRFLVSIESVLTVAVAPSDDVEIRRLVLSNHSRRSRVVEVTSYAELCLATHAADASHPAFSKLFVETETVGSGVIVAHMRPRSDDAPALWVAHIVVGAGARVECETDRRTFLGRNHSIAGAEALNRPLNGRAGAVLDGIFSLRCRVALDPRGRHEVAFLTLAAASREAVLELVEKYRRPESVSRTLDLAWTHSQLQFRHLQISAETAHYYQQLASYLLFPGIAPLRLPGAVPFREGTRQRDLWVLGISGDLPIITVLIREEAGLKVLREVLGAHAYWRARGFQSDLVILNQESPGYDRPLNAQLQRILDAQTREVGTDKPGGVFLRDWSTLTDAQRALVLNSSRAVLSGARGALPRQLPGVRDVIPSATPFSASGAPSEEPSPPLPFLELPYFNGIGGFTSGGVEYAIYLGPGTVTPSPWANVIATPDFGCLTTESGLGCTWRGNSQQNRLTTWQNDPVTDPASEMIYLRDEETGTFWSPTALPIREDDAYRARHGQGYTVFEHNSHAIGQELTVYVPFEESGPRDTVKICRLRLRNYASRPRQLTATYFAEWVLGSLRDEQAPHVNTSFDPESAALLARQTWSDTGFEEVAFASSEPKPSSYSGDRGAFFGRLNSRANPLSMRAPALDNVVGAETDPAAALRVRVTIPVGGQVDIVFLLGQARTIDDVRTLVRKYRDPSGVERGLENVRSWWNDRLSAIQVETQDLSVNFLLNRWLLYQALSGRFWGRCSVFQSSGAFGFRDQLQDCLALLYAAPDLAREHILLAAGRQFVEGDVQHWWHPGTGMGVRTRCADDLLWLPYAALRYVSVTGDKSVWETPVAFLEGPALAADQVEFLFRPEVSNETASLWEHCRRAIDSAWRIGSHGLPLIGSGDWNDGLNRVGYQGKGESVWMAWFLYSILLSAAEAASSRDPAWAAQSRERAAQLANAAADHAWDGNWYLRGFFDDGSPLGSRQNSEGRIDSLPQSWAVISRAADPARATAAMNAADRELGRESIPALLLFTPPFDHSTPHPGYVMGYPPGIRENGGQYTHGSLWMAMAWARLGEGDKAVRLLQWMNPIERSRTPKDVQRYKGEPYVTAADVYASPLQTGQSGWTWYTGSAGWMYRIWIEEVLGLHRSGDSLVLRPAIPKSWSGFKLTYRFGKTTYQISVARAAASPRVELDGTHLPDGVIRLSGDGAIHNVSIAI